MITVDKGNEKFLRNYDGVITEEECGLIMKRLGVPKSCIHFLVLFNLMT